MKSCPICCRSIETPFRVFSEGKIISGCVHPCHDTSLPSPSATHDWAMRKEVRPLRKTIGLIPVQGK